MFKEALALGVAVGVEIEVGFRQVGNIVVDGFLFLHYLFQQIPGGDRIGKEGTELIQRVL